MFVSKPASVINFRALPGRGAELLELTEKLFDLSPDIESWTICQSDEDPDSFWYLEVFTDDAAHVRHEQNEPVQAAHEGVIALLAEPPVLIETRTVASLPAL